ncbi:hypothetical protein LSAT2_026692, partial [Lamellibrachia satsuma]
SEIPLTTATPHAECIASIIGVMTCVAMMACRDNDMSHEEAMETVSMQCKETFDTSA